jgi:hypothetical protein
MPIVRQTSFYTGPTIVGQTAAKFREAGFTVTCEGTEKVWIEYVANVASEPTIRDAERQQILAKLHQVHGTSFGLN